jgi:hypothetical protein
VGIVDVRKTINQSPKNISRRFFCFMGRNKELSSDQLLQRLPGGDIMALSDYIRPGIMERTFQIGDLVPKKGPGKHSIPNALERRHVYEVNPSPIYLYSDEQALQHRRNHNRSLLKTRGKNR